MPAFRGGDSLGIILARETNARAETEGPFQQRSGLAVTGGTRSDEARRRLELRLLETRIGKVLAVDGERGCRGGEDDEEVRFHIFGTMPVVLYSGFVRKRHQ